ISLRDDDEAQNAPATPAQPTSPSVQQHAAPLDVDNLQEALETGQMRPFSLADLGLSEEEIAALGLGDAAPASAAPQEPASEAVQPEPSEDHSAAPILDDLEPVSFAPDLTEPVAPTQSAGPS